MRNFDHTIFWWFVCSCSFDEFLWDRQHTINPPIPPVPLFHVGPSISSCPTVQGRSCMFFLVVFSQGKIVFNTQLAGFSNQIVIFLRKYQWNFWGGQMQKRVKVTLEWAKSFKSRRWFQILFIFTPIWGRFPIWLIFFRWVETTN